MIEQNEKTVQVNIDHYDGEKPIEVVVRHGEAAPQAKPLETKAPESIDATGTIGIVAAWLEKRVGTFEQKEANIKVDREKLTISLTVNERDYYKKAVIKGTIAFSEVFQQFGINSDKGWDPARLGQFVRLNRALFEDKNECAVMVSQLKRFTANVKVKIEKQRDTNGSMAEVYQQEVESSLPKSFTVNMPIFKGTAKEAIEVEFDHFVKDGNVILQLVSPGANEVTEQYRDRVIDEQLEKIKALAPDIAILEL